MLLAACGGGGGHSALVADTLAPASLVPPIAPVLTPGPSLAKLSAPSGFLPAWVETLPLWQWHEIPNTALSNVDPLVPSLGRTGSRSKIDAWCGATLKRRGSIYMLGAAGGHADYAGNEVNALQLNTDAPQWVELRSPSSNSAVINAAQFYLDKRPSATHTYYASQFIDSLDRMLVFASAGLNGPFPPAPVDFPYLSNKRSFSFNLALGDWDPPDYVATFPGGGDSLACLCAKHPWTDDVYYSRNYGTGWYRWASASNTWARLSDVTRAPWYASAAIDPLRNRMLLVGGYSAVPPEVRNLDGTPIQITFTGMGASALAISGYPNVSYDEVNDRYVVMFNAGGVIQVLLVHPDTWWVDEQTMTGPVPLERANGLHNAVQYVPELRGLVVANRHNGNVLFVRTAS